MSLQIIYDEIKKLDRKLNSIQTEKHNRLEFSIDSMKYVIRWIDEKYAVDNDEACEYELDILNKAVEIMKLYVHEEINYKEE